MSRWIVVAFCSMLLTGVALVIQKCLPVRFTNQFLALLFVVGG
jgi:hypothetical protein